MVEKNILVIDGDASIRDSMEKHLSAQGYLVTTAADCIEAFKILHSRKFHLIFTELKLNGNNGLEICK